MITLWARHGSEKPGSFESSGLWMLAGADRDQHFQHNGPGEACAIVGAVQYSLARRKISVWSSDIPQRW